MCCAVLLLMSGAPRLALAWLWLATDRTTIAFESGIVGFLGFLFLPWTSLMWVLAYAPVSGVGGFGWILVGLGLLMDFSAYGGGGKQGYERRSMSAA